MKLVEIEESVTHDLTPCKSSEVVSTVPKTARGMYIGLTSLYKLNQIVIEKRVKNSNYCVFSYSVFVRKRCYVFPYCR